MIKLTVNGAERSFDGDPDMPLLWYLRDEVGLTGTKFGCGQALCGACTIHVGGTAVRGCVTPVSAAEGRPSSPSRACPPTATIRSRWLGATSTCRNAATASAGR